MLRALVPTFLLLLVCISVQGQGTLRGKITDAVTGEGLMASVAVKGAQPSISTAANLDGDFSLSVKVAGEVTIVVSFFGYATVEEKMVLDGVVVRTIELREEGKELKEFEVTRKANKRTDAYLDRMKINSASTFDFISRDAIQRTGDSDASQAVKRVSGVSTVGAFVTVRGLADRYLVTAINGSRIPTLDPFTNNLRLDLFPTGLLDNIIITKTATPDLPGDWSGAFMSLNTSDYPDRLRINVSTTFGFNVNSTFQPIVTSKSSSTDWLGHDDGMRNIPDGVPAQVEDFPTFIEPDLYQQLSLLNLGALLTDYGITANTPGFQAPGMSNTNQLQHLALTDLGLLAPALINDANAVQSAVDQYNSTYNLSYFSPIVNSELADLNTRFDNSRWRVTEEEGRPNFQQQFSIGNQVPLFKKRKDPMALGFLVGFRYSSDTDYDGSAVQTRTGESFNAIAPGSQFDQKGAMRISQVSAGWNALGSMSLQVDRNNSFSLLVMPNQLGSNNARYNVFLKPSISGETFVSEDQFYEERDLWVYQYGSKHFIPAWRMRVEADVSYSVGSRNMLDLMTVQYIQPPPGRPITETDGALVPPSRIYRFLDETLLDARLGLELPLSQDDRKARKLKFGGAYRNDERINTQTFFTVVGAPGPTQWEEPGRFDMQPDGTFISRYNPFGTFKDNDIGILNVASAFVMTDYAVNDRLRGVIGVRVEHTDLLTDILRYYQDDVAPNDPARGTVGDIAIPGSATAEPKPAFPGTIEQWDVLPSANLIYRLNVDEQTPMNVRASYFRSLARPSFRELSVTQQLDYALNAPIFGNPDLEMTSIDNFDLRIERLLKNGNSVSVSGFYKEFNNHIELLQTVGGGFTWRNADRSRIVGLELEGRCSLTRTLQWSGNVTLMDSRSELTFTLAESVTKFSTAMFGQAPFLINSTLTWAPDSSGFSASVSYNLQGPKLAVTNSELAPETVRAFEMPRHLLDLTLNQNLGRHWALTLRGRNLLDSPQRRTYLFEQGYKVDFDSFRWGPEVKFTITYRLN